MKDRLQIRFDQLRPYLGTIVPVETEAGRRFVLFFSFSNGRERARVVTATGNTVEEAWSLGRKQVESSGIAVRWLRLDWADAAERRTWGELKQALSRIKRNYFRLGISLDSSFTHAFLETELNANAMLYGGGRQPAAVFNEKNFAIYAAKRHGLKNLAVSDGDPVWLFTTKGAFVGEDMAAVSLPGAGLNAGRRIVDPLDPDDVFGLIEAGSDYLASQVLENGRFHYGWHPCFDRPIRAYNTLRHASTLYSMLEAWEVTRDESLWGAIGRALGCLTEELIKIVTLPEGDEAAFLLDEGGEIKLGGNAVAILALAKHVELTGDESYIPLLQRLGAGILHMQDPATGSFDHVLNYPALDVKQAFRIIYYDGEAAFALMRLYDATRDERWLEAVEKAFEHFIHQEHWKAHDHWLSYCANELTRHRPEERYFRFGLDNVRDHLDFVSERITTFPTLLELMMAAESMIARLRADPSRHHLLHGIDLPRFYKALHHRAHYLLNGHFWPELAMFYANPAKIVGSFFIRHHAFRIRIDDVEHYLSGLVAYRRYLLACADEGGALRLPPVAGQRRHWGAEDVERATGGRWLVHPPADWTADGLCIAAFTVREGDMIAVRPVGGERGVPRARLPDVAERAAAWIVGEPAQVEGMEAPTLVVENVGSAILDLGRFAREQMAGKVVAVTGSAGKTSTVAMLAHALQAYGAVGTTRHNANLPHGIAWNLASIPWDVPHVALELAIGRMAQNARLTRPDVAIFTNILPAHLEYHRDLATIAERKSAVFQGMRPGSTAVLNRDMAEWERVHLAAKARGIDVVHYGRTAEADLQLLDYDFSSGRVTARVGSRIVSYPLGAAGEHMALNSLAVLAAVAALGLDLDEATVQLGGFAALSGRGAQTEIVIDGRRVLLLDEAYNANPGSMEAALALLGRKSDAKRRVAVLGEMRELGDDAEDYHTRLAPLIAENGIDRVHVVGNMYAHFWAAIPEKLRGRRFSSVEELKSVLVADVQNGDVLLLKGSQSTGLHEVVRHLEHVAAGTSGKQSPRQS